MNWGSIFSLVSKIELVLLYNKVGFPRLYEVKYIQYNDYSIYLKYVLVIITI
jgi:hypothetical protein